MQRKGYEIIKEKLFFEIRSLVLTLGLIRIKFVKQTEKRIKRVQIVKYT